MTGVRYRSTVPRRGGDRLSSLAFSWESDDGSVDALSGQVGTFARTSPGGLAVDGAGLLRTIPRALPRFEAIDDPFTGQRRLGLRIEPAHTNLVLHSEDLSQWSQSGTCAVVAQRTVGDLVLDLLEDDNGAATEARTRSVTFTGNGEKVWSVPVAQGSSARCRVSITDTTAAADRLVALIDWVNALPVVTPSVGQFLGYDVLADGVFLLHFRTAAVTAANTNVAVLAPALTGGVAGTGTTWFGGGWAYNYAAPLGGVRSGAASGVVNGESLSWPFALARAGRRWWMYLSFWEMGGRFRTDLGAGLAAVGDVNNCGLGFYHGSSPGQLRAFHVADSFTDGSVVSVTSGLEHRDYVEMLVTTGVDGRPTLTTAVNGVTVGSATSANVPANLTEDWTGSLAKLGTFGNNTTHTHGGVLFHRLKASPIGPLITPTIPRVRGWR